MYSESAVLYFGGKKSFKKGASKLIYNVNIISKVAVQNQHLFSALVERIGMKVECVSDSGVFESSMWDKLHRR